MQQVSGVKASAKPTENDFNDSDASILQNKVKRLRPTEHIQTGIFYY